MIVRQSPTGTALHRAMDDDFAWGLPEQLLAGIFDRLAEGNWQRGEGKASDRPKPLPRPGIEPDEKKFGKGPLPWDEMAAWLGWEAPDTVDALELEAAPDAEPDDLTA